MIKHTFAPWVVKGNTLDGFTVRDERNNVKIADLNSYLIQAEANADLIATAPDLLALVKFVLQYGLDSELTVLYFKEKAQEAIAKAGRSK